MATGMGGKADCTFNEGHVAKSQGKARLLEKNHEPSLARVFKEMA